jgi:hypothetical protein
MLFLLPSDPLEQKHTLYWGGGVTMRSIKLPSTTAFSLAQRSMHLTWAPKCQGYGDSFHVPEGLSLVGMNISSVNRKIRRPDQESNRSSNDEPSVPLHTDQAPCKHSNNVWRTGGPSVTKRKVTVAEHKETAVHLNCLLTHVLENWLYNQNFENSSCSVGRQNVMDAAARNTDLSLIHSTQTRSVPRSAVYSIGNGILSLIVWHKDDYPLWSHAQVKNTWAYTSAPMPSWCVVLGYT